MEYLEIVLLILLQDVIKKTHMLLWFIFVHLH